MAGQASRVNSGSLMDFISGQVPCSYHPEVLTGLRCARCAKPICPLDAVRTPVGLRCPDCAGVRAMSTIRTSPDVLVKAALSGLAVVVVVAILWWFFPAWQFYLSMLMGFGVSETIARVTNNKRGRDLQLLAMAVITLGVLLSRYFLAQRFGVSWEELSALSPRAVRLLQLNAVPDLVFVAVAYVIVWVRFR